MSPTEALHELNRRRAMSSIGFLQKETRVDEEDNGAEDAAMIRSFLEKQARKPDE